MNFLAARNPAWLTPDDTGLCSSNCKANDIGIAEHLARRGFHNYENRSAGTSVSAFWVVTRR